MIIPKLIIPTIVIPFTLLGLLLTSIASFIAGLFGVHLSTEGPRKLLEVLLTPRVLITAVILNVLSYGAYKAWDYQRNLPRFESTIVRQNLKIEKPSTRVYPDVKGYENDIKFSGKLKNIDSEVTVAWEQKLTKGSFAGGTRSGDSLFIGTDAGLVQELDLYTGEILRSFYVGTAVTSTPTIFKDALYVGEGKHDTHHARIYKFDLRSGKYIGSFETLGHTEGRTIISEWQGQNLIFAPAGRDGMHAIDPATMQGVWHSNVGHTDSSAVTSDDLVFWGTGEEKYDSTSRKWAVAVEFASGNVAWKHELPASSWMQAVIVGKLVCFPVGELYFKSEVGGIFCFDKKTGNPGPSFTTGNRIASRPLLLNGDLVVADFNGRICRFSFRQADALWCTATDDKEYSLAQVAFDASRNLLVYASRSTALYVLEPETGALVTTWIPPKSKAKESNYAPSVIADGSWITSDMNGMVRSLNFKKKVSPE